MTPSPERLLTKAKEITDNRTSLTSHQSELCQLSKTELFPEIVNTFYSLKIFAKILDVLQFSEYCMSLPLIKPLATILSHISIASNINH